MRISTIRGEISTQQNILVHEKPVKGISHTMRGVREIESLIINN